MAETSVSRRGGRVQITCEICGGIFSRSTSSAAAGNPRFCSMPCKSAGAMAARPRFACENCGASFTVPPSKLKAGNSRFCSYSCCAAYRKRTGETARPKSRIDKCCESCGKAYTVVTSKADSRFCSQACMLEWRGPVFAEMHHRPEAFAEVSCVFCGAKFHSLLSLKQRYCSRQCHGSASKRKQGAVSKAEAKFGDAMERSGLRPLRQHRIGRWVVDFFFPAANLAVEFDGTYWHGTPAGIARDIRKDADIARHGFRVLRVRERLWEEQPDAAVALVQTELSRAA